MPKFSLTEKAKDDLKRIAHFTQKRWGKEQRNTYLKSLDSCFHQLGDNPAMGRSSDEIKPGYYKFPTGRHVVYYRSKTEKQIDIVRVWIWSYSSQENRSVQTSHACSIWRT